MVASPKAEVVTVLQDLVRINTVNPPGNERPAQEYLAGLLAGAGLEVWLVGPDPERPNLVARLRGRAEGPVLGLLSHVDTVPADPAGWRHDPWSGALDEGCVWGRGALDMKSQTAAEAVAVCSLARDGWRPARGDLLVIAVSDEEVDGTGAEWLTTERPDLCRCDYLLNEGAGESFTIADGRFYAVSVGEKGVFRFTLTTQGVAGHASIPKIGDNALLKMAPILQAMRERQPSFDLTEGPRAMLEGLGLSVDGEGAQGAASALEALRERDPALAVLVEPMLGVTLAPTRIEASEKINVIPSRARLQVDCRVPPGLGEQQALERIHEVLGGEGYSIEFSERVVGNASPVESPLMDAIKRWVDANDPGAMVVPTILPGFTDSRTFREAFPDAIAYGFMPHRHMTLYETAPLIHSANERVDVRDLGFAARFFTDITKELLG
jgi:acetylornithine deacetylase/succinyl-diaminopimelate desuccinylase-like protein